MADNTHSLDLERSSSQYASVAGATNLCKSTSQTMECWFKPESISVDQRIMGTSNVGATVYADIVVAGATNKVSFELNGLSPAAATSVATLVAGQWYHIAGVYDSTGNTIKIYINGILEATTTVTSGSHASTTVDFGIGRMGAYANDYADGLMDEIRFWDVARTAAQIKDNMFRDVTGDANLQGYWKLNNAYTDSSGNGYALTASGSPVFSTTVPFPTYRSLNPVALASTALASDANLKGYWPLNSNFTDSSASGYNLTATGTPGDVSGKFTNGKSFVAATSYASITNASGPNLGITGTGLSVSVWVKPTSGSPAWSNGYMVSKRSSTGTVGGYYLALSNGTQPIFFVSRSADNASTTSPIVITANNYYHIVGTYDGTNVKIYVNGILCAQTAYTQSIAAATGVPFYLALNSNDTAEGLDGELDDVAVFNRALTATEIFDLYTGVPATSGGAFLYNFT